MPIATCRRAADPAANARIDVRHSSCDIQSVTVAPSNGPARVACFTCLLSKPATQGRASVTMQGSSGHLLLTTGERDLLLQLASNSLYERFVFMKEHNTEDRARSVASLEVGYGHMTDEELLKEYCLTASPAVFE